MWVQRVNVQLWNETKNYLKPGTKLRGVVTKHFRWGMFVALPEIQFQGILELKDFTDNVTISSSEFPAVGSCINVVVIEFKEQGQQIWLGLVNVTND